jgi:hypothetical protein
MRSRGVLLGILAAMALAACQSGHPPQVDRRGLRPAAQEMPAPPYHRPAVAWRAEHGLWLGEDGALFTTGECLLCHRPAASCNPCHAYVGAPAVGQGGSP